MGSGNDAAAMFLKYPNVLQSHVKIFTNGTMWRLIFCLKTPVWASGGVERKRVGHGLITAEAAFPSRGLFFDSLCIFPCLKSYIIRT